MNIAINSGLKIKGTSLSIKEIFALCLAGFVCGPSFVIGMLTYSFKLRLAAGALFLASIPAAMVWASYASSGVEFHSSDYTIFGSMFETVILAKVVGWNLLYWAGAIAGIAWRSSSSERAMLLAISALAIFVLSLAPTAAVETLLERNLAATNEKAESLQFQNELLDKIQKDNPSINLESARDMVRDRAFSGFPGYTPLSK